MAPQVLAHPGTRPTERKPTVDDHQSSAGSLAHPSTEGEAKLAKLEERYRHELIDEDERLELRERILRIRRRLNFGLSRQS
jgi:hypothetical protein